MRKLLFLLLLFSLPAAAVTMYRWVDDNGLVHYSDTPVPGAIAIEINEVQGFKPEPLYQSEASTGTQDIESSNRYDNFAISAPSQDQVLWNIGGILNVVIDISPSLRNGDTIALYYDSQLMSAPGSGRRSYVLNDVFRGTHTVRAVVNNRNGDEVQQAAVITFQVHQTSVR